LDAFATWSIFSRAMVSNSFNEQLPMGFVQCGTFKSIMSNFLEMLIAHSSKLQEIARVPCVALELTKEPII